MQGDSFTEGKYRVNKAIIVPQVRLIDQDGKAVGIISTKEAMIKAREVGLDLVEISAQSVPPVCKIVDYGKLKYEQQKKKSEAKRKQKIVETKEVKLTPSIGDHDYQVKLSSIRRFIGDGNRIKVTLRFRGREISHKEIGEKLLDRLTEDMKEIAKRDGAQQLEGRQMVMILVPHVSK
ncbi:MAG: translation initiation factor IF-3 [Holosporaceae bacterium]|nr:translation initiation factor IF-3 [Holosporaceae bacterium]